MPEQGALAAAAAAHYYQRLASLNIKRNPIEYGAVPESPDEIVYFDDGGVRGHDQNDEWLRHVKSLEG